MCSAHDMILLSLHFCACDLAICSMGYIVYYYLLLANWHNACTIDYVTTQHVLTPCWIVSSVFLAPGSQSLLFPHGLPCDPHQPLAALQQRVWHAASWRPQLGSQGEGWGCPTLPMKLWPAWPGALGAEGGDTWGDTAGSPHAGCAPVIRLHTLH